MESTNKYFESYDDLEVHRLMLSDAPRTNAYRKAIESNAAAFKDKVVMDVGAGTGILSLFCFKAGAKKVYAVEASPLAPKLEEIVKLNKADKVIQVLHSRVEDVHLDEKVDILVSEWMGFYLLHESMLDSVLVARDHHLKDQGIMLPSKASIWASACSLDDHIKETVKYWESVYGFNMDPIMQEALKRTKPEVMCLRPGQLITDPVCVADFDLRTVSLEELVSIECKTFASVTKEGSTNFHGLVLWFSTCFDSSWSGDDGWTNDVVLGTGPADEPTHWKQTVVLLYNGKDEDSLVEEDDVIGWSLKLTKASTNSAQRHYAIQVEVLDPAVEEHPVPCSCQAAKCALIKALMEQDDQDDE